MEGALLHPDGKKYTIWILEDDPDIGFVVDLFFSEEGFDTLLLNCSAEFRANLEGNLPDIFLMDVMLPDGDGVEICQELKGAERSRDIPVLMMSANAGLEKLSACNHDGFIPKPFDLSHLRERVVQLLV